MADVMHKDRWPALATLQFRHKVMLALLHTRWDGPQT
jgi:hypothetical protein